VEEVGAPDAIVVSVGGGGLLCGVLEGLKRHGLESVTVAAVETEGTASLATSLREGRLVTLERIAGVARSLGAKTVAQKAFEWSRERPVRPVVVSDAAAAQACVAFADDHRCLVEPACGASLSLAYSADPCLADAQLVVCGGIGVDLALLQGWRDGAGNA
jgi:L-serine/L-threonine ammonia-lyase